MTITLFITEDPALVSGDLQKFSQCVEREIPNPDSQSVILSHIKGDPPYSSYCHFYYLGRGIPCVDFCCQPRHLGARP